MGALKFFKSAVIFLGLGGAATGQVAILQIQVVEGEGSVHAPGSRSARPLTVEVTDETGRPIDGAVVSFHLPEEGPSGTFANGLRTVVATTDGRGRASAHGMQFNRAGGRFQVRILASKEQARAGTVSFQYISGPTNGLAPPAPAGAAAPTAPTRTASAGGGHRARWIAIAALVGGGAAAGLLASRSGATTAIPVPPAPVPALTIGTPSLTVGHP